LGTRTFNTVRSSINQTAWFCREVKGLAERKRKVYLITRKTKYMKNILYINSSGMKLIPE
jgi:hypothetical protein